MSVQNQPSESHSQSRGGQDVQQREGRVPGRISSTVLVILTFIVLSQIAFGIYAAKDIEPSGSFTFLYYIILICLIGYWLQKDSRKYHISWVFDMGFFLYLAWPLIMPYYLFKTRGPKKGGSIILGFIGVYLGAYFVGGLISLLFLL